MIKRQKHVTVVDKCASCADFCSHLQLLYIKIRMEGRWNQRSSKVEVASGLVVNIARAS